MCAIFFSVSVQRCLRLNCVRQVAVAACCLSADEANKTRSQTGHFKVVPVGDQRRFSGSTLRRGPGTGTGTVTPRYECFPLWPSVKLSAHMINICGQRHCSTMHSYLANSIWLLSWPSAIFSLINRVVWLLTFNCEFHTETHKRLFLQVFLAINSIDVFGIYNFYDVLERIGNRSNGNCLTQLHGESVSQNPLHLWSQDFELL